VARIAVVFPVPAGPIPVRIRVPAVAKWRANAICPAFSAWRPSGTWAALKRAIAASKRAAGMLNPSAVRAACRTVSSVRSVFSDVYCSARWMRNMLSPLRQRSCCGTGFTSGGVNDTDRPDRRGRDVRG